MLNKATVHCTNAKLSHGCELEGRTGADARIVPPAFDKIQAQSSASKRRRNERRDVDNGKKIIERREWLAASLLILLAFPLV